MLIGEIRGLTTSEIEGKVDDAREEQFRLRFQFHRPVDRLFPDCRKPAQCGAPADCFARA